MTERVGWWLWGGGGGGNFFNDLTKAHVSNLHLFPFYCGGMVVARAHFVLAGDALLLVQSQFAADFSSLCTPGYLVYSARCYYFGNGRVMQKECRQ